MLQQQQPFKEKKIFQDVGPWKRRWHPEKCLPDIFPDKILVLFLGLVSYRLDAAGFAVLGRGLGFCYLRGGLVFASGKETGFNFSFRKLVGFVLCGNCGRCRSATSLESCRPCLSYFFGV